MALTYDRAAGALFGQAVGDALGAPTENIDRADIVRRWVWVSDFLDDDAAGTDDTEYAVLTAWHLLEFGERLDFETVAENWRERLLTQESDFLTGGFSEMGALANLRRGLGPPHSGSDHHEPFSDGAAMRCGPIGIRFAGDPAKAARFAEADASVSHHRDGIDCARAVAAGVAVAVVSDNWRDVCAAALAEIAYDGWTARMIRKALSLAGQEKELARAVDRLVEHLAINDYPWTDVGPEAVALAFGCLAAAQGHYVDSVLAGVNAGRDADTIAAMAGAMAGGLNGIGAIPPPWVEKVRIVRGRCIEATKGADLDKLAKRMCAARQVAA